MKQILTMLCILAITLNARAQNLSEADVPAGVKSKFASMFKDAGGTKWEKEDGTFEAEFEKNKMEIAVLFDASGNHLQTETEIEISSLPRGVSDYISINLPGKSIKEAAQITAANGRVTYEADMGNADYLFDAKGNFLREDTDDGEEVDDKDD
jgi:hypothetical protein